MFGWVVGRVGWIVGRWFVSWPVGRTLGRLDGKARSSDICLARWYFESWRLISSLVGGIGGAMGS